MFVAMLYVATGKTSWVLIGLALVVAGVAPRDADPQLCAGAASSTGCSCSMPIRSTPTAPGTSPCRGSSGLPAVDSWGTGWGQGRPEVTPLAHSDYIITSLGEELGLIGLFAILCLYMVFVSRGMRIGLAGQDDFGKLLATGLSFTIALQVFIMVGGVTRLIPLTGLTTPFLAAGGSSLVAKLAHRGAAAAHLRRGAPSAQGGDRLT